jgi:hypothetical protein
MLGCEIVGAVGDSRHAEKVGSSNALLRPCSSTPNFQNGGDDRQRGYTDRTRVRTPHEPNERVAVPTVGVSQAIGIRFPAISTVLCPPPAGAPGRSPVGVWRIRVNAVRRARPSGIGAPFPMLSPPSDLFISVFTCDSTQVIEDTTSSSRHCQEPPGLDPTCATPKRRNLDARSPRNESAGNRSTERSDTATR